ncbi:MAG: dockerin type I repeat-containing protein [candidate division Zixibacteria bacterium]|nr:dockerin type I repeat-containing protein [candidate division Zixibacteria bacterium]
MKRIANKHTILLGLLLLFGVALSDTMTGEEINWQVISSGGAKGTSTSYVLNGTVGQTAVGGGISTSYGVSHGFWQDFGSGSTTCCVPPTRGNVDYVMPDEINIADLTYLVSYLFTGGPDPLCMEEADINGDGEINIADLTYLVSYLFTGGPEPAACP